MGKKQHVEISFEYPFQGIARNKDGYSVNIGIEEGNAKPYDLLLSALGSCLYATFLSIANKKELSFKEVEIELSGEKRDEVPTTRKTAGLSSR